MLRLDCCTAGLATAFMAARIIPVRIALDILGTFSYRE